MTIKDEFNQSLMRLTFIKLGLQIKINRKSRGITVPQLAKKAKITSKAMRSIERGNVGKLKIETLIRITNAFNCEFDIKFTSTFKQIVDITKEPEIVPDFEQDKQNLLED